MSDIKMNIKYKRSNMDLPFHFIDHYLTDCLPVYPLIYIWSLRRLLDGEVTTTAEICERFSLTEGDVIKAWKHWENKGLVSISAQDDQGGKGMNITFLPMDEPIPSQISILAETTEYIPECEDDDTVIPFKKQKRPRYTSEELACYCAQSREIQALFNHAENYLGRLVTYTDMNVIFSFYDWLRLPIDVIEFLLSHCADNDHRNLKYIEKCAIDWAENNIKDVEQALLYVQSFNRDYRKIMAFMGLVNTYPTPSHRKYMDKWLHQWKMPMELIEEACDRSVGQINTPKFNYVNKILSDWHDRGISGMEELKTADADFVKPTRAAAKPKNNRFINFNQRENDYAHYEKLERAYLAQQLKVSE